MEKNRKLDPMDPKIFDIPRPSLSPEDDFSHGSTRALFDERSDKQGEKGRMFNDRKDNPRRYSKGW